MIAIINYNAGNIYSVEHAFKRLNTEIVVTDDKKIISQADKVIFPGVGEASSTMLYLRQSGMDELILGLKQPILGICLGMQLMCSYSEEGNVDCLKIFDCDVKRFVANKHEDKIPHMGWNTISDLKSNLFDASLNDQYVYFVHSFYAPICEYTAATTDYILPFSAALHKDNFYATQFHPEKSGCVGEQILKNFLEL
ncbi:imidazole glycerol phosphate synthase subunit HisH [Dysgonomonas massiliensis]|uniref:imidazole glycerol phosphate synthase subunit HisH n=1 Tax=Dysgonomonas massiliensis TaxID=2040292 RepID=UPI000C773933|nr:imidazole glycerol phosphate synthase subunit HisH [Dysgonomonas massiliensis]